MTASADGTERGPEAVRPNGGAGAAGAGAGAGAGSAGREVAADAGAGVQARVEQAPPEVDQHPGGTSSAGRAEFSRFPTGPVGVGPIVTSGPDTGPVAQWEPPVAEVSDPPEPKLAPWALLAACVALVASFFVGWGIPVAIVAVVAAIMCLRRPMESQAMARWALVLGLVATAYSTGWLIWAASQFDPTAAGTMG